MFAAIPPRNDDPIDVDLDGRCLKRLLYHLRTNYAEGPPEKLFRGSFCHTCLAEDLASFYVWFKRYQFDEFAAAALAIFHTARLQHHPWQEALAIILGIAQDANDIQLARAALEKSVWYMGSLQPLADRARTRLSAPWFIALLYGIISTGGGAWTSPERANKDFGKRLSDSFAQQLEVSVFDDRLSR